MTYLALPSLLMYERMEAIREIDMPEGLEIMYERILVQIYKASRTSFKLAAHVFTCLLYGNHSLKERELEDSVVSRKRGGIDEQSRSFSQFRRYHIVSVWRFRGEVPARQLPLHSRFCSRLLQGRASEKTDRAQLVPRSDSCLDSCGGKSTFSDSLPRVHQLCAT